MPISGCHDLPLATFNLPSRNSSQSNRKRIPQNKKLKPLVLPLLSVRKNPPPTPEQPPKKKQKPTSLVPSLLRWHGAA